ncbi:MAG: IS110 family transposase [Planctomycetales bacterium]|nr:IS110 family transposase [Planctomycetales bacterium]
MKYVGLDIGKRWIYVCILKNGGGVVKEFRVRNDGVELIDRLRRFRGPLSICFEASCGYGYHHDQLAPIAKSIQIAHPGHLRLIFKSKRKNDRVDARKLATLLLLNEVPAVHVPDLDVRAWRSLIEFRDRLVTKRTRVKNGLRAICRSNGIAVSSGKRLWSKKGIRELSQLALPHHVAALERDLLLDELEQLSRQIGRIECELDERGRQHLGVQLLQTIPGVGPRTAEAFVAYVDRPQRFARVKQVGAYFGLVPCQDQSGAKNRLGHITRDGPSTMRRLLTQSAWQAVRRSPRVTAYYERIRRGDPERRKIALVATSHYLVRVMHAMLRRGEVWNEAGGPRDTRAA